MRVSMLLFFFFLFEKCVKIVCSYLEPYLNPTCYMYGIFRITGHIPGKILLKIFHNKGRFVFTTPPTIQTIFSHVVSLQFLFFSKVIGRKYKNLYSSQLFSQHVSVLWTSVWIPQLLGMIAFFFSFVKADTISHVPFMAKSSFVANLLSAISTSPGKSLSRSPDSIVIFLSMAHPTQPFDTKVP